MLNISSFLKMCVYHEIPPSKHSYFSDIRTHHPQNIPIRSAKKSHNKLLRRDDHRRIISLALPHSLFARDGVCVTQMHSLFRPCGEIENPARTTTTSTPFFSHTRAHLKRETAHYIFAYLFDYPPRDVEKTKQQFQLHLRLKIRKTLLDVTQHFLVQL